MLRALVAFLAVTSVSGVNNEACVLNSARAVDDILDTMVYIMASIVRCDPGVGDKASCALDVSASIEAVNRMVMVLVKALDECGDVKSEKPECGFGIGELTRSMAELTSASAGIVAKCPNEYNGGKPLDTVGATLNAAAAKTNAAASMAGANGEGFNPTFGQCIINVKDSVKSLFKAVKRAMTIGDDCTVPNTEECAHNSLKLVDAFVGLAEFISGAVGKCGVDPKNRINGVCAQMAARLTHAVSAVGVAGTQLAAACEPSPAERLYLDSGDKKIAAAPASSGLTMGLTALLPITAVVAFVAGKRLAKVRSVQPLPDEEMLVQNE